MNQVNPQIRGAKNEIVIAIVIFVLNLEFVFFKEVNHYKYYASYNI